MKLLLDEQISPRVAERLQRFGHDAIAVSKLASLQGKSDEAVFLAARETGRAVVTYDRDDFLVLAAGFAERGLTHDGLVIINPKRLPSREFTVLANALDRFIREFVPWPGFVTWLP
ncbi:MAG: DUF5615 family PIN-like protein [Solirubrobacterales bacterium]